MTVTANSADDKPAHFALYYPTADAARVIPMGPFPQTVAINGAPEPKVKGLIVISHGTASTELGFATLALALARNGYLVASVEHVGDPAKDEQEEPVQADPRVRAVIALAPMGVAFSAASLASITVPVAIYAGEKDTFLVPRFRADGVSNAQQTLQTVSN